MAKPERVAPKPKEQEREKPVTREDFMRDLRKVARKLTPKDKPK